ncbi:MAG: SRPBCC family protein [Bacteroidota bacterium]
MPTIEIKTIINADIYTCFDLARDIDFHASSMEHTKEKAVAGKTSGLISLGETVTWEAIHFGIKQHLTSKITAFESPYYFVDEMVEGAFKSFKHKHLFQQHYKEDGTNYTLMTDIFQYKSPLGILGSLADVLFLKRYMIRLLQKRCEMLKTGAENIS